MTKAKATKKKNVQSKSSKPKAMTKARKSSKKQRSNTAKLSTAESSTKKSSSTKLGIKKLGTIKSKPLEKNVFATSPVIHKDGSKVRVLVGKVGLDGHDRGAKVIARAFRDAGFEVVYTGLHQTTDMVINTAIQEDVDVLGLSILSGAHNYLVPEIAEKLKKQGVRLGEDMLLIVGGIIPESDFSQLKSVGVSMVFTPGSSVETIVEYVRAHVKPKI